MVSLQLINRNDFASAQSLTYAQYYSKVSSSSANLHLQISNFADNSQFILSIINIFLPHLRKEAAGALSHQVFIYHLANNIIEFKVLKVSLSPLAKFTKPKRTSNTDKSMEHPSYYATKPSIDNMPKTLGSLATVEMVFYSIYFRTIVHLPEGSTFHLYRLYRQLMPKVAGPQLLVLIHTKTGQNRWEKVANYLTCLKTNVSRLAMKIAESR